VAILDYKIELNILVRVERKASAKIVDYNSKIQELARGLLTLRDKLYMDEESSTENQSLEENMETLVNENRELKVKLETLSTDVASVLVKAKEISETVSSEGDSPEAAQIAEETKNMMNYLGDLKIEIKACQERQEEYEEMLGMLDQQLKIATKELRNAKAIPPAFISELKHFQDVAEILWDSLFTTLS